VSAGSADRGLKAVRRVREARERDSRIGLQHALATTGRREEDAARSRARLETAPAFAGGSADEYRLHALRGAGLAGEVARTEELLRSSRAVADEARRRWAGDRQAVRVVELLLERRAAERRAERARLGARDLDELAGQAWVRARVAPETATAPDTEEQSA